MELTLNLGWALVAVWILCAWVRTAPRRATDRRVQMVALAVVILILLPAISMTDDLLAAQNPAEIDCCARRNHDHGASPHSILPAAARSSAARLSRHIARLCGQGRARQSPLSFYRDPLLWHRSRTAPLRPPDRSSLLDFIVNFLIFPCPPCKPRRKGLCMKRIFPSVAAGGSGRDCSLWRRVVPAQQALTWDQVKAKFEAAIRR